MIVPKEQRGKVDMLNICLFIVIFCALIVLCAAFFRRDIFERILYLNTGTSITSLFICLLGSFKSNGSYIDIALIYFLLGSIVTTAYMKYFLTTQKRESHDKL